ncbi:MAG: hypothetical protein E7L17_14490 [Clostridium sp.]|uniref:hypothetical protein n=1 Tax=Clostridium sp. TaxID=1506 RepID=UPI0029148961|nr:hypothetical protein [Clostridium sp.]MDU7339308.1 hypothetical protein [Clostridium sp.]
MDRLTDAIITVNLLPSNYNLRIDEENAIDKVVRAAVAFNAENLRPAPENNPLTLDQIRQMDGQPVYIKDIPPYDYEAWKIISNIDDEQVDFTEGDGYRLSGYNKTWIAYARKPKQEEK